ncbi:MAG: type II toxin-antitoxin system VapC family toxin [Candidatus Methanoperedens sp.]|nr:type II toxin-antitoxin system VapC family toxin [Candidatus Methanoperedens sp.]
MIETMDLLIAAIALQNGCKLLTNNKVHFEGIEGLSLHEG